MPFGLKNIGASYHSAMQHICADMLHKDMEDYIDIIVKSMKCMEHHATLQHVFHGCRENI